MAKEYPIYYNKELKGFGDRTIRDVGTSFLDSIGSSTKVGLWAGLLSLLPAWAAMKLLGQNHAGLKALGISALVGAGGKIITTPYSNNPKLTFGQNVLGKPRTAHQKWLDRKWDSLPSVSTGDGYAPKVSSELFPKTAADYIADLPNTDKLTLHDIVSVAPGFTQPQRDFLHNGIYNTPSSTPNVMDLAGGFMSTVNNVTGGLLPMTTRAIEGALIGQAFGAALGVQPGTKKIITGAAALADGLAGNRLFNTISQVY